MAYKPVKQILFIITLIFTWGEAQGMQKTMLKLDQLPSSWLIFMTLNQAIAHQETGSLAWLRLPKYKRNWLALEDAHKEVHAFVAEHIASLKDSRLPKNFLLKKKRAICSMAATPHGLEINRDHHDRLLQILQSKHDTLSKADKDFLSYYEVVIKHECGHIRHKDIQYTRLVFPITSIAIQGLTWAVSKLCSAEKYYKPSFYEDSQSQTNIFKGGFFLIAAGVVQAWAHEKLITAYARHYKEKRAQQYALDNTKNPETLRGYARHELKELAHRADEVIDDIIAELKKKITGNLYFKYQCHLTHRRFLGLNSEHRILPYSKKSLDAFRAWLKTQEALLDKLKAIAVPTHPSFLERIQQAQKTADKLEA